MRGFATRLHSFGEEEKREYDWGYCLRCVNGDRSYGNDSRASIGEVE